MTRSVRQTLMAACLLGGPPVLLEAQTPAPGPAAFTAAQAEAGRGLYAQRCAGCHLPDLGGRNEALPLAGSSFQGAWATQTTADLYTLIHATMPPGAADLSPDQAAAVTAYILQANGGRAGSPTA